MKTERAIELAGGTTALAEVLGISQSAVSQWGEDMPEARMWQLRCLRPSWFRPAKPRKRRGSNPGQAQEGGTRGAP